MLQFLESPGATIIAALIAALAAWLSITSARAEGRRQRQADAKNHDDNRKSVANENRLDREAIAKEAAADRAQTALLAREAAQRASDQAAHDRDAAREARIEEQRALVEREVRQNEITRWWDTLRWMNDEIDSQSPAALALDDIQEVVEELANTPGEYSGTQLAALLAINSKLRVAARNPSGPGGETR